MEEEKIRLFVGGLASDVSAGDLQERFAPLGIVERVTLPPGKAVPGHRGFAYVDFVPATDASLRKLFSAYNGCKWRGGFLRIEKAKEHFTDRLHREWAVEAASLIADPPAKEAEVVQESSLISAPQKPVNGCNGGDLEASGLKIFFPRLRKLKTVPLTGLGKHKRSFQRVESSPLQLLLTCACKESSRSGSCDCSNINGGYSRLSSVRANELLEKVSEMTRDINDGSFKLARAEVSERQTVKSPQDVMSEHELEDSEMVLNWGEDSVPPSKAEEQERALIRTEGTLQPDEDNVDRSTVPGALSNHDEDTPFVQVQGFQDDQTKSSTPTKWQISTVKHNGKPEEVSSSGQKLTRAAWKSLVGETGRVVFSLRQVTGSTLPHMPTLTQETRFVDDTSTQVESIVSSKTSNQNQMKAQVVGSITKSECGDVRPPVESKMNARECTHAPMTPTIVSCSEVCPFMKSENAENEWLATKSELRSDYRAKKKYAARNVKKLWGKR